MKLGDHILLKADGGEIIERCVVAVDDECVAVCKDDEYAAASNEGRKPLAVYFKLADVIQMAKARRASLTQS